MSYNKPKTLDSNKLISVNGTVVNSTMSATSSLVIETYNLSSITKDGEGYLFEASLTTAANANAKGFSIKVGSTTIFTIPTSTSLNNKGVTLKLMIFRKSSTIVRYMCEYKGVGNPIVKSSGDSTLTDFIGSSINIEVIANSAVAASDITLNGTSLTILGKE